MGDADANDTTVEKGEEHIGARVDEATHRKIRIAAAERDEPMTDFIRYAVGKTLAELEEGNRTNPPTAAANS
jgi:uncharacterized protein (DUF1778 family)